MKYAFVKPHSHWPIQSLCQALKISVSGYQAHCQRQKKQPEHARRLTDQALVTHLKALHREVRQEYGWPRMHRELRRRGLCVGKRRIQKLMQIHGLRARHKRKWIATTNSNHKLPVAENLLTRNFTPAAPNQVWSTDITYIPTAQGWLYLTVVLDLHSRQIVGWSMQDHMRTELVVDALKMAWFRRQPPFGLIVHSDRGSQYCSAQFQDTLKAYGLRSSMSRKANCWDNAPTESLWGARSILSCNQFPLCYISTLALQDTHQSKTIKKSPPHLY